MTWGALCSFCALSALRTFATFARLTATVLRGAVECNLFAILFLTLVCTLVGWLVSRTFFVRCTVGAIAAFAAVTAVTVT
jgi:hypothetical protein